MQKYETSAAGCANVSKSFSGFREKQPITISMYLFTNPMTCSRNHDEAAVKYTPRPFRKHNMIILSSLFRRWKHETWAAEYARLRGRFSDFKKMRPFQTSANTFQKLKIHRQKYKVRLQVSAGPPPFLLTRAGWLSEGNVFEERWPAETVHCFALFGGAFPYTPCCLSSLFCGFGWFFNGGSASSRKRNRHYLQFTHPLRTRCFWSFHFDVIVSWSIVCVAWLVDWGPQLFSPPGILLFAGMQHIFWLFVVHSSIEWSSYFGALGPAGSPTTFCKFGLIVHVGFGLMYIKV